MTVIDVGITSLFDDPFYVGSTTTRRVPHVLPIGIAGHGYMMEPSLYQRSTTPRLRNTIAQSAEPGEDFLDKSGPWPRRARRWDHGVGQDFWDQDDSDRFRFHASKGIDVWTSQGVVQLLRDTRNIYSTTAAAPLLISIGGYLVTTDLAVLKYTADPTGASPSWSSATAQGGTPQTILSLASDGRYLYQACGSNGIYRNTIGAATNTQLSATAMSLLGYGNGHLLGANANVLYEVAAGGGLTTLYTHFNANATFVAIIPSPQGFFVALNNGDHAEFLFVGFNASTAVLATPIPAGSLPYGETCNCLEFDNGLVFIGTSLGFRLGQVISDKGISPGPLTLITGGVRCCSQYGSFIFFGWKNYDSNSTGLGRADLSTFTDTLVPAYTTDLMTPSGVTKQGAIYGVATWTNASGVAYRYFAVDQLGVYAEYANLLPSGTIQAGWMDFGAPEDKTGISLDVRHAPLSGSVGMSVIIDTNEQMDLGSSVLAGSLGPASPYAIPVRTTQLFDVLITLNRSGSDATLGPMLKNWKLQVIPVPPRVDQWVVPVYLTSTVSPFDSDVSMKPLDEFLFLKGHESSGVPVTYQEGTQSYSVIVDRISAPADKDRHWTNDTIEFLEGLYMVELTGLIPTA